MLTAILFSTKLFCYMFTCLFVHVLFMFSGQMCLELCIEQHLFVWGELYPKPKFRPFQNYQLASWSKLSDKLKNDI